jgi:two-component system, cell cycle sensor histidine kinase and response regulator CckA
VTERERALEALRISEERFRLVSRATKEAVWDWDVATDRLAWNPMFTEVYGVPSEAIEETLEWRESRIHPDDLERTRATVATALATQQDVASCEYRFRRGDGTYASVADRIVIAYRDGKPTRAVGSMADVTSERRLSEQLAAAQRMEAVGRLAGGLAHDLNNVLTAISGFAGLAADSLGAHDPVRSDVHQIQVAADRAADLIRQLMAYSRQQVLKPQVMDVNAMLSGVQRMLERLLGEDIEFRLLLAPKVDPILVDPGQMEQVVLNLVVNARDAMPSGGRLTVETANVLLDEDYAQSHPPTVAGSYVLISVADTGMGMDAETQSRIFEPFFTTKERGRGTGLGLATTYGIVRQSGGHIWVYSEPGRGATFKVFFPRTKQAPAVESEPVIVDVALEGDETILLVEDDPRVRRVASRGLERFGYRILEAGSAEDGLQLYTDHAKEVAMVVSDVVLPRMSGPDLIQWLRKLRPSLKVLFMSGYSEDAVEHHGRLDPDVALLEKPFTTDTLVRRVREILDR